MITSTSCFEGKEDALIRLNRKLDTACAPYLINEAFIGDLHARLMHYEELEDAYYWLLYARITEAALLCAGNYADNCEYSAAGDLLVNPRRIEVQSEASAMPAIKCRHGAISEQFKPKGMHDGRFRKKFFSAFKLKISQPALLPSMADALERSGAFCESYLVSISDRMKRIADTLAFLSAWPVRNRFELQERLASAPPDSRRFIHSNLCRFSPAKFEAMGAALRGLERIRPAVSASLAKDESPDRWCNRRRWSRNLSRAGINPPA